VTSPTFKTQTLQKTLRKPENWQYFESLCKKLWGELWGIPHKIKKNGRLGQPQNGVDVYGIPKNENGYWGIQCKGKNDEYLNSKLTNSEIDEEIEKAKTFSPKLEVFIIATTQSKDVGIEKYVREKDIENRENGSFEIILLCWEDIVDLIEENRETLNWYLGINNFRDRYDFEVTFSNGTNKTSIKPKFLKSITKYRAIHPNLEVPKHIQMILPKIPTMFESNEVNRSWCSLEISLKNIGNVVLEDWYVKLKLNKARKISDDFNVHFLLSEQIKQMMYDNRTLWGYEDTKEFLYEPVNKEPLIQKSGRTFTIYFIPEFDQKNLKITWELFARDFDKTGFLEIEMEPEFKEEVNYIKVGKELNFKEDKIEIKELIEEKK
tara:strand:- start:2548 stop:3681 length:1134 start_codon:yes stop_codon:yes gene_type:complete